MANIRSVNRRHQRAIVTRIAREKAAAAAALAATPVPEAKANS